MLVKKIEALIKKQPNFGYADVKLIFKFMHCASWPRWLSLCEYNDLDAQSHDLRSIWQADFFPTDDAGQDGDEADGDVDGGEGDEPAHGRHEDRSLDHQNRFDRVRFGCAVF